VAGALQEQGKQTEAEAVSLETLAVQRRVLGPEHPNTLITANKLSTALTLQGKHVEAEAMYLKMITVERRVLLPEHPRRVGDSCEPGWGTLRPRQVRNS
jgi:hypothetical protein